MMVSQYYHHFLSIFYFSFIFYFYRQILFFFCVRQSSTEKFQFNHFVGKVQRQSTDSECIYTLFNNSNNWFTCCCATDSSIFLSLQKWAMPFNEKWTAKICKWNLICVMQNECFIYSIYAESERKNLEIWQQDEEEDRAEQQ